MRIALGDGKTPLGPGVLVDLSGDEIATAIYAYLVAHDVWVSGPRTVFINGALCDGCTLDVDPTGYVIAGRKKISGRGDCCTEPVYLGEDIP